MDPEEALTFAAELAPSEVALQIMKNSLAGKLRQDPLSAVQWMTDHVPAAKMTEVGYHLFSKYAETHPDQARSLLPQLPDHLKNTMLEAILEHGIKDLTDPRQIYANSIQTIQSFPEDLRIPAWRMFLWGHGNEENGRFSGDLLNAATSPAERAVVVEKLAWTNIANFEGGLTPENLAFLQQFEIPEDKQSAARVVPFLGLTETRQQDILNRLK